ncbi:MAG: hypothetical protein HQ569_09205 [Actinobacteria bacterium]|nr:hypothetical protein [Actinomycetota bacterium]
MHGIVLLAKDGSLLRKVITWADFRAIEEITEIESYLSQETIVQITGSPGVPMMPGPKILWIKKYEPHVYYQIKKLLFPKDYIGYIMTGEIATDPSDASNTMFYNCVKRQWDEALCNICAVPMEILPPVKSADTILGLVTHSFATKSLIPAGTPVIIGGGDMPTTVIGTGIIYDIDIGFSLGTAGTVFRLAPHLQEDVLGKIFYYSHVLEHMLISMGTCPGSLNINWFDKQVVRSSFEQGEIVGNINQTQILKPPDLYFMPFLSGTGSPYMDYEPKGAFLRLSSHHNQEDLRLAIYEGVSYSLKQSFELLMVGRPPVEKVFIGGGGSYNKYWLQVLANIIGLPLITLKEKDVAVIGAAILGGYVANWFDSIKAGTKLFVKEDEQIFPQPESVYNYKDGYKTYLKLSKMVVDDSIINK